MMPPLPGSIRRTVATLAAIVAYCLPSGAQTVEGPALGYVLNRNDHSLHRVLGVEGAAVAVSEARMPSALLPLAVSPRGEYVLVLSGDERRLAVWTSADPGRPRTVNGLPANPDRVVLSPEGHAFAALYRSENRIVTVSGLPGAGSPVTAFEIEGFSIGASSQTPGFALSDDGKLLLTTSSEPDSDASRVSSSVVVWGTGSDLKPAELNRVKLFGPVTAMAFASGSHDAIVATDSEAFIVRGIDSQGLTIRIATEGLGPISAAAISPDGTQALLLSAASSQVAAFHIDSATPAVSILKCNCSPVGLERVGARTVYNLNPYDGSVSWMLDLSGETPRIVSVPSAPGTEK